MPYHIRVRPTALIMRDDSILLCEYTDDLPKEAKR